MDPPKESAATLTGTGRKRKRRRTEDRPVDTEFYEPDLAFNPLTMSLGYQVLECAREVDPRIASELVKGMKIRDWAKHYHLTKDGMPPAWARQIVLWSLKRWKTSPDQRFVAGYYTFLPAGRINFSFEYDPLEETRKAARTRIFATIKEQVDNELDRVESELVETAEQMGRKVERVPGKREQEHLKLFVRYQVLAESKEKLIEHPSDAYRRSIDRAFKRFGGILQIDLRKAKPGPKGFQ